jgi:hypothetical protein
VTTQISKEELIATLRTMVRRPITSKDDLKAMESDSWELWQRIKDSPVANETPHAVWHFLSDADIRFKDPRYIPVQTEELLTSLREWEKT